MDNDPDPSARYVTGGTVNKGVIKTHSWYAVFSFPVFFTAFEWLLINFSGDGTAASIAYSQSNFLPLIQIASITGILGITFMATFIPSVVALGWHFRGKKSKILPLMVTASFIIGTVFIYGFTRINPMSKKDTITVGLVVMEEKTHKTDNLNFQSELGMSAPCSSGRMIQRPRSEWATVSSADRQPAEFKWILIRQPTFGLYG